MEILGFAGLVDHILLLILGFADLVDQYYYYYYCCESINKSLKGTIVNWPIKGLSCCCELSIQNLQSRKLWHGEK